MIFIVYMNLDPTCRGTFLTGPPCLPWRYPYEIAIEMKTVVSMHVEIIIIIKEE